MRQVAATTIALSLLVITIGCAKKAAKNPAPARDTTSGAKTQPAPSAPPDRNKRTDKGGDPNEANWLTDPRFKKDQPKFDPDQVPGQVPGQIGPPSGPSATGKQPWGIAPPEGGWQAPVPGVQPHPMGAVPPFGSGPNSMFPPPGVGPNQPVKPGANLPPAPGAAAPGVGKLQPDAVPGNPPAPGAGNKAVTLADMRDLQVYIHDASLASGKMPTPGEVFVALLAAGSPAAEHLKSGAIILTNATDRASVWGYETRARADGGMVVSQNGVETLTAAQLKQRLGQ
jgi:hypothetical protein